MAPSPFFTAEQRAQLLAYGRRSAQGETIDPRPIVRLFTPDANAVWLLTELDPRFPDQAFGLCDLGLGCPELGWISLPELAKVRGRFGLRVERDFFFRGERPLSAYAAAARRADRIAA